MRATVVSIIIIFTSAIILGLPLLKPGLHLIHDDQQIARLYLYDKALKDGQIPPRWVEELGFGFGYPLFVFYPPFVYMLGDLFHNVGFGYIDSIKLVFFFSIFLSGITMYILTKELWGIIPALVSSLFYMLVPYRAIDVYIRGALAESFAFVWLPLIFWSFLKLQKTTKLKYLILSAIFLTLLMITHNLIFLPFIFILIPYLVYLVILSQKKIYLMGQFIISLIFAAGLSAFFWIPSLLEKKYTIVDQLLLVNLANYKIHFVYPQQLWNWPWGFGGSAAGLVDGISFKIGKIHVIVSTAALIFSVIHLFKIGKVKFSYYLKFYYPILIFFLFVLCAFMTTYYSQPLWNLISPLAYLQFPWRFLIFTAFTSSVLAGAFVYLLRITILKIPATAVLILLLFIPNLKLFQPQSYRTDLTDQIATSKEVINWDVSGTSFEYLPKGVDLKISDLGTNVVNITKSDIPEAKVEVVTGKASIENLISSSKKLEFVANAESKAKIRVNIFNFPGWQVKIDGQQVAIDDNNPLKLITFIIPQGKHVTNVKFENIPTRSAANYISLAFILMTVIIHIKKWPIRAIR